MITFDKISNDIPWNNFPEFENFNVFQTHSWHNFLQNNQNAETIVVSIQEGDHLLGYFSGLVTRKFGLKMLGSPLRGWNTDFMGFFLKNQSSIREILKVFPNFVFNTLKCHYLEIIDPEIKLRDVEGLPMDFEIQPRFILDLTKNEDELFANMKGSCRNLIRQSVRKGVIIEETEDFDFLDEYYAQITQVFAKQSLEPPYSFERVKSLIETMLPTRNILLLQAKGPSGNCIATGIFVGFNKTVAYWGAASWREFQSLRPNEALVWYGIRYWKAKGIKEFHFGGGWEQYKSKYGCEEISVIRLMKAKYPTLDRLRVILLSLQSPKFRNWSIRRF